MELGYTDVVVKLLECSACMGLSCISTHNDAIILVSPLYLTIYYESVAIISHISCITHSGHLLDPYVWLFLYIYMSCIKEEAACSIIFMDRFLHQAIVKTALYFTLSSHYTKKNKDQPAGWKSIINLSALLYYKFRPHYERHL